MKKLIGLEKWLIIWKAGKRPSIRIQKMHPKELIIGDPNRGVTTRSREIEIVSNSSKPQLKDNIIWFIAIKSSLTLWNLDVLIMIYPVIMQVLASKTKIYMVLEYVNGGELFDKIVRSNCLFIIHIHDDLLPNWQSQSMNYFVFTGIQR